MSRSSARRGQVEPLVALVALVAVCAGLSLYAGVLTDALATSGGGSTSATADRAADRARGHLAPAGVASPARLDGVDDAAPDGYRLNATLACRDESWAVGPGAPRSAARATESVSVRVAPGEVRPCRLAVEVWT